MAVYHSDFEKVSWTPGGHPLEFKKLGPDPRTIQLKFLPGFRDPNWCTRSHVLIVLSGQLTVETDAGDLVAAAGEVVRVVSGSGHRAENRGSEPVELLAVSDLAFADEA